MMLKTKDTLQRENEEWSRHEYALLGAFAAGCMIFVLAFAYLLGFGHNDTQTAGLIPPATIGERAPIIPVPR